MEDEINATLDEMNATLLEISSLIKELRMQCHWGELVGHMPMMQRSTATDRRPDLSTLCGSDHEAEQTGLAIIAAICVILLVIGWWLA